MPIYEYVCQGCRHGFEVRQSFSDPPVTSCPQCGQAVTKVISAPAIMFKGSGWYVTDYSDKFKPGPDAKTEDKNAPAEKKDGEKAAPAPAATATEGSTASTAAPSSQPAPAAKPSPATTTPATPASSPSKERA